MAICQGDHKCKKKIHNLVEEVLHQIMLHIDVVVREVDKERLD